MESSRSGLLSTLIMTVPLIVVPAFALLRPATSGPGFVTEDLQAAGHDDFFNEEFGDFGTNELGKQPANSPNGASDTSSEDFSDWFSEENSASQAGRRTASAESSADAMHDPFAPPVPGASSADTNTASAGQPPANRAGVPPGSTQSAATSAAMEAELMQQLKAAGAARTMWFSPGSPGQTGFIAFIPIAQTSTQYRFEAIAATPSDAVQSVLQQILVWRAAQKSGR